MWFGSPLGLSRPRCKAVPSVEARVTREFHKNAVGSGVRSGVGYERSKW